MLTGKAKTDYQREYMREWQRKQRGSKQGLNTGPSIPGLKIEGNKIVGLLECHDAQDKTRGSVTPAPPKPLIPLYDRAIHKTGDKVLMRHGRRLIETVVPELDLDGNPIEEG